MTASSPQPLAIATPNLLLRHFTLRDAALAHTLSLEPSSQLWLPSQIFADEAIARERLAFLIARCAAPGDPRLGPYVLAIEHRASGVLIGHVGLSPFDDDVEIGFAIAEAYQRQGLAVEAVTAACRWAFERFALPCILGIAAQANDASRKVLARAGFAHQDDREMNFQGTAQTVSVYGLPRPVSAPLSARGS